LALLITPAQSRAAWYAAGEKRHFAAGRRSGERLGRVTISIGVALLRTDDTSQSLIERADNCLYAVKRQGRDRVNCETEPRTKS
jgi:GGDEF domain-containing protein